MSDVALPIVVWYLAVGSIGWAALPYGLRLFRSLPDRGAALMRPLGLLVVGYVYWMGGVAGVVPNSRGGVFFIFLCALAAGAYGYTTRWDEVRDFFRRKGRVVLAYEALFLLALVAWAVYRAASPNIEPSGGEKYMDMAFTNAILRSGSFPPNDPWMSGLTISYYYFGYLQAAMLIAVTGLLPSVGFNLIVPTSFALTVAGAAGIGYDLAALTPGATSAVRAVAAAVTALLVAVVGNLEGALEVAYLNGVGSPRFWNWLNVKNLTLPTGASLPGVCGSDAVGFGQGGFIPARFIWWWRASRVIHDGCDTEIIHEFPFFSYLLGDAHPHVMGLPYLLLVAGIALAVLTGSFDIGDSGTDDGRFSGLLWTVPWLVVALAVGAMGFLNAWDLPVSAGLVGFAYLLGTWRKQTSFRSGTGDLALAGLGAGGLAFVTWRVSPALAGLLHAESVPTVFRLATAAAVVLAAAAVVEFLRSAVDGSHRAAELLVWGRFATWLGVLAMGLYLPFYLTLGSQVQGVGRVGVHTRLAQWLVHMGGLTFFAGSVVLVAAAGVWSRRARLPEAATIVLAVGAILAAVSAYLGAWTAFLTAVLASVAVAAALAYWRDGDPGPAGDGALRDRLRPGAAPVFALLLAGVGFGLVLAVEFVFVRDLFGNRMNSVFKFYYQSWTLLALAGGYAVVAIAGKLPVWARAVWSVAAAAVIAASLVYPAAAIPTRVRGACWPLVPSGDPGTPGGCSRPLTLDGLAWWDASGHADDRAAAAWLRQNVSDAPTIVEASGGSYGDPGRMAMATGFPTVLGWDFHEAQWGRSWEDITPRADDVERIYTTSNAGQLLSLLAKYDARYMIVGQVERDKYGLQASDTRRYEQVLQNVAEFGGVTIYRVPAAPIGEDGS